MRVISDYTTALLDERNIEQIYERLNLLLQWKFFSTDNVLPWIIYKALVI